MIVSADHSNAAQVQMSLEEMAKYPRPLLAEQPDLAEDSFCQVNLLTAIKDRYFQLNNLTTMMTNDQ